LLAGPAGAFINANAAAAANGAAEGARGHVPDDSSDDDDADPDERDDFLDGGHHHDFDDDEDEPGELLDEVDMHMIQQEMDGHAQEVGHLFQHRPADM
jgi:hypothetical protein